MSGCSYVSHCPNCGSDMDSYVDRKPYDYYYHECLECGLVIRPVEEYRTLKELNSVRKDQDLPGLRKRPCPKKFDF